MSKTEDQIQKDCYVWFHNTYPKLRGLLCYNLNNSKHARDGMKNKSMGLQAGRSDMVFYYHKTAYMIEFKTLTGTQQKVQKGWQKTIEAHGFSYDVVRSLEDFKALFKFILND